jgi:hypothetical protein
MAQKLLNIGHLGRWCHDPASTPGPGIYATSAEERHGLYLEWSLLAPISWQSEIGPFGDLGIYATSAEEWRGLYLEWSLLAPFPGSQKLDLDCRLARISDWRGLRIAHRLKL